MNTTLLSLVPKVSCPLMPKAFREELRACNIPRTRAKLLKTESICCDTLKCFPWEVFPAEAKEEADPREQINSGRLAYFNA